MTLIDACQEFVLAQGFAGSQEFRWSYLLNPAVIWIFIPITAIICGTVTSILRKTHKHRERMAMIQSGMHPDYSQGEEPGSFDSHR